MPCSPRPAFQPRRRQTLGKLLTHGKLARQVLTYPPPFGLEVADCVEAGFWEGLGVKPTYKVPIMIERATLRRIT